MKQTLIILSLFLLNCSPKNHRDSNFNIPEIFHTNYDKMKTKNLKLNYGDIVEFEIEKHKIEALLVDIKQEKDGNWFGLCLLNKGKLFGRKIPDGISSNCIELLDVTYLNEKGLFDFKIKSNEKLNFKRIGIGSNSPAMNIAEILRDYKRGIEERKKKESSCNDKFGNLNPVNQCYFSLQQIK